MLKYRLTRKKVIRFLNRRNRLLQQKTPFKFIKGDLDLLSAYLTKANRGILVTKEYIAQSIMQCDKSKLMGYFENFENRLIVEYNVNTRTEKRLYNGRNCDFVTNFY